MTPITLENIDQELIPAQVRDNQPVLEEFLLRLNHVVEGKPPYIGHDGRLRTKSLFWETVDKGSKWSKYYHPIWTLRDRAIKVSPGHIYRHSYPGHIIPSFREAYLELRDPTEYLVGSCLLGSYPHWVRLSKLGWMKDRVAKWREELEILLESEAIKAVRTSMIDAPGPQALQAAKWLAERAKVSKRGRPSKAEIAKKLKEDKTLAEDLKEDLERIGLS